MIRQKISNIDFDEIKMVIQDSSSNFYYPLLLKRFYQNDPSLSKKEYELIYYGKVYCVDYNPYGYDGEEEFRELFFQRKYVEAIPLGEEIIKKNPVNLQILNYMRTCHHYIDDKPNVTRYANMYSSLLKTILESGDGTSINTAYVVIMVADEYEILDHLGLSISKQTLSGETDILTIRTGSQKVKKGEKKIEELYFNVSKPLNKKYEKTNSEGIAGQAFESFENTEIFNEEANNINEMTLTLLNKHKVKIEIAATGNFTIDWGDDTSEVFIGYGTFSKYNHKYPNNKRHTIKITGDCVFGLQANKCNICDISGIDVSKNKALKTLSISSNALTRLNVSKNPKLTELICNSNSLNCLILSYNTELTILDCSNNNLRSLDVNKNTMMRVLDCSHNNLTSLDISKNSALTDLNCSNNYFWKDLFVSYAVALEKLNCQSSKLESLDVSTNTRLTELDCSENILTSLDLTKNTALTRLECYSNDITYLDVSKNSTLTYLYCHDNQLTNIDVSKNSKLTKMCCMVKTEQLARIMETKATFMKKKICYDNNGNYSTNSPLEDFHALCISVHNNCFFRFEDLYSFSLNCAGAIAIGLFAVKLKHHRETSPSNPEGYQQIDAFTRNSLVNFTPSDPFLYDLFQHIASRDLNESIRLIVDDIVDLLNQTDFVAINHEATEEECDIMKHFANTFVSVYQPSISIRKIDERVRINVRHLFKQSRFSYGSWFHCLKEYLNDVRT